MKHLTSLVPFLLGAGLICAQGSGAQGSDAKSPPTASQEAPVVASSTQPVANQTEEKAKAKAAAQALPDDYKIGAGDVLQISVWKEPEASAPNVIVRPDGKVSMPLLKDIEVAGMTPLQVEAMVTEKLSKLISEPDVTVVVTGIHSQKVYAVGSVKHEGPIAYTYRMSIMQAISEAGGLTEYAKKKKIYVLRNENGKESKIPFDYEAAIKGEHQENNIRLIPGDTLVVP